MRLQDDTLFGLRVETTGGAYIGRVAGFTFDAESGVIIQYRVRPRGIVAACFPGFRELLIGRDQVVSINAARMVVGDNAIPTGRNRRRRAFVPLIQPQPNASRLSSVISDERPVS